MTTFDIVRIVVWVVGIPIIVCLLISIARRTRAIRELDARLREEEAQQQAGNPYAEMARLYAGLTRDHSLPAARVRAAFGNVAQQEMRPWINGQFAGCYLWNSSIDKFTDTLRPGEHVELASYPLIPGATDAGLLYRPAMMFAINHQTPHPQETAIPQAPSASMRRAVPDSEAHTWHPRSASAPSSA